MEIARVGVYFHRQRAKLVWRARLWNCVTTTTITTLQKQREILAYAGRKRAVTLKAILTMTFSFATTVRLSATTIQNALIQTDLTQTATNAHVAPLHAIRQTCTATRR